jgi:uncharacterized protein YceK
MICRKVDTGGNPIAAKACEEMEESMKKFTKVTVLLMAVILLLPGCGTIVSKAEKDSSKSSSSKSSSSSVAADIKKPEGGYKFTTNEGITIKLDQDVKEVLDTLGKPKKTFEAQSCAFQGVDNTFLYVGYQIVTYPMDNVDHIATIDLLDKTVATEEGIRPGSTLKEVIAAYGKDYKDENGSYTYTAGKTKLTFTMEKNAVKQITYSVILGGAK